MGVALRNSFKTSIKCDLGSIMFHSTADGKEMAFLILYFCYVIS